MSSTTARCGFLIPAVGDLADETLYYDNNITILEAELPSLIVGSLPGSGNYNGRVRSLSVAAVGNYAPPFPEQTYCYNAGAWIPVGAFGTKVRLKEAYNPVSNGSSLATVNGPGEVFETNPMTGFSSVSVTPNTVLHFSCQFVMTSNFNNSGSGDQVFTGSFNIFLNPNSGTQPTPTTPGAIRLSFPVVVSSSNGSNGSTFSSSDYNPFYGELLYVPGVSSAANWGASAYLSATYSQNANGNNASVQDGGAFNTLTSGILVRNIGLM